jgi:2-C-methyl-D-erythritol 4-phosphate cytidylyltransferase
MDVWIVVVAGGSGARFGGPKQLAPLGDRRVLDWSIMAGAGLAAGVVVVVPSALLDELRPSLSSMAQVRAVVAGGATRSGSVRAGLAAVPADAEVVVVHDAARPLASAALFERVIAAVVAGADAAVPGVAVTDTLREVDGGAVDRTRFVAVQTPQAFRAATLRRAHAGAGEATDDASLVEAIGGKVVVVPGEPLNFKVTDPHDLVTARAVLGVTR